MLTASAETDLAVAKACGVATGVYLWSNDWHCMLTVSNELFRPSADLSDAFFAANKFCGSMLYSRRRQFYVALQESLRDASGMTGLPAWPDALGLLFRHGPLAICEAVLKTAGTNQE